MTQKNLSPEKRLLWEGTLPVTSRYTAGVAGEKFFRELKDQGAIMGTHCPKCNKTLVPGTIHCEFCLTELDEWVDVGLVGTVDTYTLLYHDLNGEVLDPPEIIAFIRIADGGLIHKVTNISINEIKIGIQVAAKVKPKEDRIGSILDIESFIPIKT
jgi:uncharacterized OB-fold protein